MKDLKADKCMWYYEYKLFNERNQKLLNYYEIKLLNYLNVKNYLFSKTIFSNNENSNDMQFNLKNYNGLKTKYL